MGTAMMKKNRLTNRINFILEEILLEGPPINQVLQILTSKKSKWRQKKADPAKIKAWVRDVLTTYDPSSGKYLAYIAKQAALGERNLTMWIGREEDGDRIKEAIEWFAIESKKNAWGALLQTHSEIAVDMTPEEAGKKFGNINNIKSWRYIEDLMNVVEGLRREGDEEEEEGEDKSKYFVLIYELEVGPDRFKAYKLMEPEAFCLLGKGTNWCTSRPSRKDRWEFTYPNWHPKAGMKRFVDAVVLGNEPEPEPGAEIQATYPNSYTMTYWKNEHYIVLRSEDRGPFLSYWQFGGAHFMHKTDRGMTTLGVNEDYFLGMWTKEHPDEAPLKQIATVRNKWAPGKDLEPEIQKAIMIQYGKIRPPIIRPPETEEPVV